MGARELSLTTDDFTAQISPLAWSVGLTEAVVRVSRQVSCRRAGCLLGPTVLLVCFVLFSRDRCPPCLKVPVADCQRLGAVSCGPSPPSGVLEAFCGKAHPVRGPGNSWAHPSWHRGAAGLQPGALTPAPYFASEGVTWVRVCEGRGGAHSRCLWHSAET